MKAQEPKSFPRTVVHIGLVVIGPQRRVQLERMARFANFEPVASGRYY